MYHRILVPLDGTPLSDRTVEQALTLARTHGAELVFLHVHPDASASEEGALLMSLAPALFAEGAQGRTYTVLARAEAAARAAGLPHRALAFQHDKPHQAILTVARQQACDLIFMASHGRRGWREPRLGGVTRRVLDAAGVPVLVTAVEVNLALDAHGQALAIIRAEHRSMAAVAHALLLHWRQIEAGGAPRIDLMRAMLYYIEHYPERRHHPREEEQLFARLRERTQECNALIERLLSQHIDGTKQFESLRAMLDDVAAEQEGAGARFGQALEQFVKAQWEHMACEERLVLPAADRWFTSDDWEAVASAFSSHDDPRFGADSEEAFETLADRLLRLAANPAESSRRI